MKKNVWIAIAAGVAAVVAGAIAVATYLRKKSKALSEHLDYDPDEYFEDECDCCDEECSCEEDEKTDTEDSAETEEEETIPIYPEEVSEDEKE